ncbi:hypothetical protein Nm8I071_17140 [Nonomuraea sp. TT08I-71]|nr:hypothetical protein Nm8I071_17140 [Nonomuraea sp. TT08I-71]
MVRVTNLRISRRAPLCAALSIVAAAALASGPFAAPAAAAASDPAPARVYDPWLWQATIGQRPAGPASVVFYTSNTRYFESTGVLVGRDGAYRLIPLQVGEDHGLLSPDGRHYVRPHRGVLVDLTTGAENRTHRPGVRALAWSPDGRTLLGTRDNDDAVITYGPDNQQLNDPAKPDDLVVVDPYDGSERVLAAGTFASHATGAWSPDGNLIVVAGPTDPAVERQRLTVTDAARGGVRWQRDLDDRHVLAGRGAWSPDGARIALLAFDGCAGPACGIEEVAARSWRLEFLDAATGQPLGASVPVGGWATELVGWRNGDAVLNRLSRETAFQERHASLVAVAAGGREQVLVTAPPGVSGIDVPADLLADAVFADAAPRPSPWAAPLWLYPVVALPALLLAALLAHTLRRRRKRRASPG